MKADRVKLTAKRGGNGYVSGYATSISGSEAEKCALLKTGRVIKIADDRNECLVIKAKHYTLTDEIIDKTAALGKAAAEELNVLFPAGEMLNLKEGLKRKRICFRLCNKHIRQ